MPFTPVFEKIQTMPVIVLGGIKHTGKSTAGKNLSVRLNFPFDDLDDLILMELPYKWTIRKWYREKGAQAFMDKETLALQKYLDGCDPDGTKILALGGGTLENARALELLKKHDASILILDEEEEVLYRRIIRNGIPPFLDTGDPRQAFGELYKKRRATLIEQGDHIINIHNLDQRQTADELVQVIRSIYGG